MPGMQGGAQKPAMPEKPEQAGMPPMPGMHQPMNTPGSAPVRHGPDSHGSGNQSVPMTTRSRLDEPGDGLGGDGRRVLVYTDLRALEKFDKTGWRIPNRAAKTPERSRLR